MGITKGDIFLTVGFINLFLSIWRPGLLLLAIVSLYVGYRELKGEELPYLPKSPHTMPKTDEETISCPHCETENLAVALACRGCGKSFSRAT